MKVIKEERLLALLDSEKSYYFNMAVRRLLTNELKEIDTLTVSKLRPMCDAPINVPILAKFKENEMLLSVCLSAYTILSCYEGWLPTPIYKPEE